MEQRNSAAARIFAALALVVALLAAVVVASSGLNGGDADGRHHRHHKTQMEAEKQRTTAKTYTVETGDTLTAIAHRTGVPVAEILALNPEVDPQILIAGQTLKLR